MLKEGDKRAKALLLPALLDIYQSKPMRVNMKEPVELEPMKKIDQIRRFSNKKLRLSKESMGALPKSSEYCGPIRKKSCRENASRKLWIWDRVMIDYLVQTGY